jgi:hypothetical protein
MTITDRGEKRSGMIIKDRSKAALNLESLKLINGVPSHIWDPNLNFQLWNIYWVIYYFNFIPILAKTNKLSVRQELTCRTIFLTLIQNNRQARDTCKAIPQTLIQNCYAKGICKAIVLTWLHKMSSIGNLHDFHSLNLIGCYY